MEKKWFRVETKVEGCGTPFVDWYEAEFEGDAIKLWLDDAKFHGLPLDKLSRTIREANEDELKVINKT